MFQMISLIFMPSNHGHKYHSYSLSLTQFSILLITYLDGNTSANNVHGMTPIPKFVKKYNNENNTRGSQLRLTLRCSCRIEYMPKDKVIKEQALIDINDSPLLPSRRTLPMQTKLPKIWLDAAITCNCKNVFIIFDRWITGEGQHEYQGMKD